MSAIQLRIAGMIVGLFGFAFIAASAASDLADEIDDHYETMLEQADGIDGTPLNDLLRHALRKVNWREIAEHYLADAVVPESMD